MERSLFSPKSTSPEGWGTALGDGWRKLGEVGPR